MQAIHTQEHIITNPLNNKLTIEALSAQLDSAIFKELIQGEKYGIKLTFTISLIENEDELNTKG